jgi:hypothetical protein
MTTAPPVVTQSFVAKRELRGCGWNNSKVEGSSVPRTNQYCGRDVEAALPSTLYRFSTTPGAEAVCYLR